MNAWQFVVRQPWAMTEAALAAVLTFADRLSLTAEMIAALHAGEAEAVQARVGKPMDGTRSVKLREGVATIPVKGPISRYAGFFSDFSGGTTVQALATDLRSAVDNPAVQAIILEVNSPGGQADGIGELANMIFEARGRKPVVAYVSNLGASAAYYLASAASEIVMAPSATVGSIGVVTMAYPKEAGPKAPIEFVSSQSPKKWLDPASDEGRAEIQQQVDALAEVFVADVARFRGITPETVLSNYGAGGVKVGKAAVEAGMADRIGSYESLLSELARGYRPGQATPAKPGQVAGATGGRSTMKFHEKVRILSWLMGTTPAAQAHGSQATEATEDGQDDADVSTLLASLVASPKLAAGTEDALFPEEKVRERVEQARAEERANARQGLAAAFKAQAAAFLATEVKAGRVVPADVDRLAALYVDFAMADQENPIKADAGGKTQAYSRLEHFTAEIGQRGRHGWTEERIPADTTGLPAALRGMKLLPPASTDQADPSKPDASMVLALLQATDEGRGVLASLKSKAN